MTQISDATLSRMSEAPQALQPVIEAVRDELSALKGDAEARPGAVSTDISRCAQRADRALSELESHLRSGSTLPLTVALMGGTNTGKSTTLNLIAGREVSREKVTANATKRPLIYAHARWREALLSPQRPWPTPELSDDSGAPVTRDAALTPLLSLHEDPALEHLILIDCPDLDSTETMNIHSATDVTRWADRALFVVTPQKYKDELLVQALCELLARGQRVHVLFNLITEEHQHEVMSEDLQQTIAKRGAEGSSLCFEEPTPRLSRERRAASAGALQARLLSPLLRHDHHKERQALLSIRASRALETLERALEALTLAEEVLEELARSLKRFIERATQALRDAQEELGEARRSRVEATLRALSLPALSQALSAARPRQATSSTERALPPALLVALGLMRQALSGSLGWLSAQLIKDATWRLEGGARAWSAREARGKLMGALSSELQALSEALERHARPLEREGDERGRIFTIQATTELAPADVLVTQGASSGRSLRGSLYQAALGELSALLSSPAELEGALEAHQVSAVGAFELGTLERAQLLSLKALCGVSLAYLSFGLGPWDLLWAPVGFELGSYLVAWRLSAQRPSRDEVDERSAQAGEQLERALIRVVVAPVGRSAELELWPTRDLKRRHGSLSSARASLLEALT